MGWEWLPTPPPARPKSSGTVTGEGVAVRLSDPTAMLLKLVASHDGLTVAQAIDRLVGARAEEIGVPFFLSAAEPPSAPDGASPAQGGRGAPGRAARCSGGGQP